MWVAAVVLFFVSASRTTSTGATADVVTYHNDVARTGQNLNETILSPANVAAATFGKVRILATDGKVDAQPLSLSDLSVPSVGVRDVVYVATEHDSVYAFDANAGSILWSVSLLGTGETTSDTRGCSQVTPEIGITSTPVIDRSRGPNGIVYVVAMSKTSAGGYIQRLHALDAALGTELLGGPKTIQASYPGTGAGSAGGSSHLTPSNTKNVPVCWSSTVRSSRSGRRTATSTRTPGGSSPMTPAPCRSRAYSTSPRTDRAADCGWQARGRRPTPQAMSTCSTVTERSTRL